MSALYPDIPEKVMRIFELNFVEWTQEQLNEVARHSELGNLPPIDLEILQKDFPNLEGQWFLLYWGDIHVLLSFYITMQLRILDQYTEL